MINNLNKHDAISIVIAVTEAFDRLPWAQLTRQQQQGALLLYEETMQPALVLVPRNSDTAFVFDAVEKMRQISKRIREAQGIRT